MNNTNQQCNNKKLGQCHTQLLLMIKSCRKVFLSGTVKTQINVVFAKMEMFFLTLSNQNAWLADRLVCILQSLHCHLVSLTDIELFAFVQAIMLNANFILPSGQVADKIALTSCIFQPLYSHLLSLVDVEVKQATYLFIQKVCTRISLNLD